jgi:hypothetical protein
MLTRILVPLSDEGSKDGGGEDTAARKEQHGACATIQPPGKVGVAHDIGLVAGEYR